MMMMQHGARRGREEEWSGALGRGSRREWVSGSFAIICGNDWSVLLRMPEKSDQWRDPTFPDNDESYSRGGASVRGLVAVLGA